MHRDPNLRKRNALAISGTLVGLLSLAGIVYSQILRPDTVTCEDGTLVVLAGACRSAALLLLAPLALGLILLGLSFMYRAKSPCHVGHGTVATTVLALLVTLTFLPLLAGAYLRFLEDPAAPYVLTYNEVDFSIVRLLGVVGLGGFLALAPFLGLYIARSRPRRCCREKSCFEPCFCDEAGEASGGGDSADAFAKAPAAPPETETDLPAAAPPLMQSWAEPAPTPAAVPVPPPPAPVPAAAPPARTPAPAAPAPAPPGPPAPTPAAAPRAPVPPPRTEPAPAPRKSPVKPKAAPAAKATRRVTRKK